MRVVKSCTLKIRGGVRHVCQAGRHDRNSRKGTASAMGEVRDTWGESRSDIVCLEGNGCRPSHKGDGWRVGGGDVHIECDRGALCGI